MNLLLDQPITADEFEKLPGTKGFELVDGKPVERHGGAQASHIGGELVYLFHTFMQTNPIGWVFSAGAGYRCFPDHPNSVRKPSVSFVRYGRFPDERLPRGYSSLAPDLAVEVVSPNDMEEVETKVADFRHAGVRLIWVIHPPTRNVLIRRLDGTADEVGPEGELNGEDVIPGFRCRVADLFQLRIGDRNETSE